MPTPASGFQTSPDSPSARDQVITGSGHPAASTAEVSLPAPAEPAVLTAATPDPAGQSGALGGPVPAGPSRLGEGIGAFDSDAPLFRMPSAAELASVAVPFRVPLSRRFRGVEHREGLALFGPSGWAEWAPFPEYDDVEAARWLACAVEAAWGRWPEPVRDRVPVNIIVPALPPDEAATYVADAVARTGASTVKVKVAQSGDALADDLARVATVRAALSEAGVVDPRLRLDANGAWNVTQARRAARMFDAEFGGVLDYLEQPCATIPEMAELRYRLVDDDVHLHLAVDEGLRRAPDLFAPELLGALRSAGDVLIVKVAPLGGVWRALRLVREIGLPVVVSGAMDTSIGLAAGIALAGAVPELAGPCGLGTGTLLADDLVAHPTVPRDGVLPVGRRLPDEAALCRAVESLPRDRALWWRERLARCSRLLHVI